MHRCLQILEIIDSVCDYLDPAIGAQPYPVGRLRDLAVLSRTCTLFEGPAQDHVWRKTGLGTLLVACMPLDLWAVDQPSGPWHWRAPEMRLLRPIRDSDWDRIRFHAPRVRHLSCSTIRGVSEVSVLDVLPALSLSLPQPLFTNLQGLVWQIQDNNGFPYIRLFIASTLKSVSFGLASDSAASLLPTLATRCPELTHLSVSSFGYEARGISELVVALRNPHTIIVPSLNWDALEHLSRCQTLRSLDLKLLPTGRMAPMLPGAARFPTLRTLRLTDPGILPTTRFLHSCRATPLATFTVYFHDLVTAAEMHELFVSLSAGVVHDSLAHIVIDNLCRDSFDIAPDATTHLIPHSELRLLQSFTNLNKLSIATPLGFMLDDAALDSLLPAWPRLASFDLEACFSTRQPSTTLACLQSFARHCPWLKSLSIALDTSTVPALDLREGSVVFVRQRTLILLDVEGSAMTGPKALSVARFISALFPNLRKVVTQREHEDNDEHEDDEEDENEHDEHLHDAIQSHFHWKEVEGLLPEIAAIRKEGLALGEQ
ncbi:hypothetical protein C8R46DRAFT_1186732 [Mycena filopes]|nr:hypothetical protein C8R46DRAFT_1186732 [Mycena filopes]